MWFGVSEVYGVSNKTQTMPPSSDVHCFIMHGVCKEECDRAGNPSEERQTRAPHSPAPTPSRDFNSLSLLFFLIRCVSMYLAYTLNMARVWFDSKRLFLLYIYPTSKTSHCSYSRFGGTKGLVHWSRGLSYWLLDCGESCLSGERPQVHRQNMKFTRETCQSWNQNQDLLANHCSAVQPHLTSPPGMDLPLNRPKDHVSYILVRKKECCRSDCFVVRDGRRANAWAVIFINAIAFTNKLP